MAPKVLLEAESPALPEGLDAPPDLEFYPSGSDVAAEDALPQQSARARPVRILLLAVDFTTPYRVLRCAAACGAEVYVLGNAGAQALRWSRYCRAVIVSDCIIHGERDEALALEINHLAEQYGIQMVVPADAPSARSLICSRDLIEPACFPLPSLQSFDILNNKWSFAQLCGELGIRHPETRLLADTAAVEAALAAGSEPWPLMVKPLGRCAGAGVTVLNGPGARRQLRGLNYRPLLIQALIPGRDIGASVFAREGRIEAFIAHELHSGVYSTFRDEHIYADLAQLVRQLDLDGVYNFDMIRAEDGTVWYLECNPRFFFKINLSMVAGINFVECGLPGHSSRRMLPDGISVRFPKALLRSVLSSGRCARRDWTMAHYLISDPWPLLVEKLHLLK